MIEKILGVNIFDVEVTNNCNYRCQFCPVEKIKPKGYMTVETFQSFLDNVPLRSVDSLSFVGIGEPLLNQDIFTFIGMAKKKYPNVMNWLTTNGSLLNADTVQRLVDCKLDVIDISFNGINALDYEDIMRGGKFEKTLGNIKSALNIVSDNGGNTKIQVNFLDGTPCPKKDAIAFWKDVGVSHFRVGKLGNRSGTVTMAGVESATQDVANLSCNIFDLFTFIAWNGNVQICCNDTFRENVIGNITRDNWDEIKSRKLKISQNKNWPSICKTCSLSKAVWDDKEVVKAIYQKAKHLIVGH